MPRKLTPATSLGNLRKEAKRWLRDLRSADVTAREQAQARMRRAWPAAPATLVLHDVQHALAREYEFADWKALRQAIAGRLTTTSQPAEQEALINRFLEYACPDHHTRGRPAHRVARHAALRLLQQHPEIARANIYTAVVCGEREEVERLLQRNPELANARNAARGRDRSGSGSNYDFLADFGTKAWTPLLFLCLTRLDWPKSNDNAVAIARLLLDHGADPNAYFMAGDSRYTPLTGAIGEGEEDRPPHSHRDQLVSLLLERRAEPYDPQVIYNIHFHGNVLWWLKLIYEFSVKAGRAADWQDPEWHMLDVGNYGAGARWHLWIAIENGNLELAKWCLEHGANPNSPPPKAKNLPQRSLYEEAVRAGHAEIAELLARHGAERLAVALSDEEQFVAACLRLDQAEARRLAAAHAEHLQSPKAVFAAARRDRADVIAFLLEVGVSMEVEDAKRQRTLHVAAASNALAVAGLLVARGAEIDPVEQNWGNTPLDAAIYHDHPRLVELLARHSRNVWNLVWVGAVERLREVLEAEPHKAKVTGQTTPLFWLPEDEDKAMAIAQLFLRCGADPAFRNPEDGTTAADVARKRGLLRVAELLETNGVQKRSIEHYEQAARDFVAAHDARDEAALLRLNQHYARTFSFDDLFGEIWRRIYAYRQRSSREPERYLKLEEAQTLIAQDAGYGSWPALVEALPTGAPPLPAYALSGPEPRIAPRRRLSANEWDELIAAAKERRVTHLDAKGLMNDDAIKRVAALDSITSLNLAGSRELSEEGLRELARMPQLEELNLGGNLTDRGLEVLRHLPNLRRFGIAWQRGITDAGIANLRQSEQLEEVDLMGTPTGDGAIEALRGKPKLRRLATGRNVTDHGIAMLHDFPQFRSWHGPAISLVSEEAMKGATRLLIDGPFTDAGLAGLAGLAGIFELVLFWHATGITSNGLGRLAGLPNLGALGCDGALSDDTAMRHYAALPKLMRLIAQGSVATDDGFESLSCSRTLQYLWTRETPNLTGRGFRALAQMPALRSLGVSCKQVDGGALATLPQFPLLNDLTPIDVKDEGFRHIGKCALLERLSCMYCRDTTDAATAHIAALPLRYYYAGLTQITDLSLAILGNTATLEKIELYDCRGITDAGLQHLAALPNLKEAVFTAMPGVTFGGTRVFPARVRVGYET